MKYNHNFKLVLLCHKNGSITFHYYVLDVSYIQNYYHIENYLK